MLPAFTVYKMNDTFYFLILMTSDKAALGRLRVRVIRKKTEGYFKLYSSFSTKKYFSGKSYMNFVCLSGTQSELYFTLK